MPNLTQDPVALGADVFTPTPTALHSLGARGVTKDGRVYRYCQAGIADLVAGNVIQSSALVPLHLGLIGTVINPGTTVITVTPGATSAPANAYAEGYLGVDTAPGNGITYGVSGHGAITASTAFQLTLKPDDSIQTVAWSVSTRFGLIANPYKGAIQAPLTTGTGTVIGVAPVVIPAGNFGWLQTAGIANVLVSGTPGLNAPVVGISAVAAGSVDVATTTNLVNAPVIGYMAQTGVAGKNNFVRLQIAY